MAEQRVEQRMKLTVSSHNRLIFIKHFVFRDEINSSALL